MYANELIGKKAIRTKPIILRKEDESLGFFGSSVKISTRDYSFTSNPIIILAATENHIIYKYDDRDESIFGKENRILNCRYCDDGWTDYDALMKLAEPTNMKLMQELHSVANSDSDLQNN